MDYLVNGTFSAIVDLIPARCATLSAHRIGHADDMFAADALIDPDRQTLARITVD